jgi:hypothetical protein
MNPAILVIANLVLFVAGLAGGFMALQLITHKVIGFFHGARFAVFTEADAKSQRKHRLLLAATLLTVKVLSCVAFFALGAILWSYFALAATIGLALGVVVSFCMSRGSLMPEGWDRKK